MGMPEGRAALGKSVKELLMHWSETKQQWNDGTAIRFEKDFIVSTEADAKMAVNAMDQMTAILSRIRHDCEPE